MKPGATSIRSCYKAIVQSSSMTRRVAGMSASTNMPSFTPAKKPPIDFFNGWPNPSLLPPLHLDNAAHTILSDPSIAVNALKYAPDEGYHPLRNEIAKWLTKFYGPRDAISPERLCITGGASQNMACILQTFTDPIYTRNIWMVAPTYFLACRIFDDSGFSGRLRAVPEDEEGIDIEYLRKHVQLSEENAIQQGNLEPKLKTKYPWRKTYKHIFYAVPTFANPSGSVMSRKRREDFVKVAREFDALIVTDDVYDMLQWPTNGPKLDATTHASMLPRLVDVDRYLDGGTASEWGNALSNGSFSKIIAPGCRTGWAEATPKLSWALSQCGSSRSGGAPSGLVATMLHRMMASGNFESHLVNVLLPSYKKRYNIIMQAIRSELIPLGVKLPRMSKEVAGGYFIWLTLPGSMDGSALSQQAAEEEDVKIVAGSSFRVVGDDEKPETQFKHEIRLCFAHEEVDRLEEGIARLARVIRSHLNESG